MLQRPIWGSSSLQCVHRHDQRFLNYTLIRICHFMENSPEHKFIQILPLDRILSESNIFSWRKVFLAHIWFLILVNRIHPQITTLAFFASLWSCMCTHSKLAWRGAVKCNTVSMHDQENWEGLFLGIGWETWGSCLGYQKQPFSRNRILV